MPDQKEDGGLAFPAQHSINNWISEPRPEFCGMTLRDYFAAKAMQAFIDGAMKGGLLASVVKIAAKRGLETEEYVALKSYEQADAMLQARKK